jgi:hypothetical protein
LLAGSVGSLWRPPPPSRMQRRAAARTSGGQGRVLSLRPQLGDGIEMFLEMRTTLLVVFSFSGPPPVHCVLPVDNSVEAGPVSHASTVASKRPLVQHQVISQMPSRTYLVVTSLQSLCGRAGYHLKSIVRDPGRKAPASAHGMALGYAAGVTESIRCRGADPCVERTSHFP